jgi:hypothetical protein
MAFLDVWSSMSGNAFNPPRQSFFNSTSDFNNHIWDYAYSPDNLTFYTYLLLNANQSIVFLNPLIVDENGRYFDYETPIVPVPRLVECNASAAWSQSSLITSKLNEVLNFDSSDTPAGQGDSNSTDLVVLLWNLDILQYNVSWSACERQMAMYFISNETSDGIELLGNLSMPLVNETCNLPSCTSLYLMDYQRQSNYVSQEICMGKPSFVEAINAMWYKACKESVYSLAVQKRGRFCKSDCLIPPICFNENCYGNISMNCNSDDDCIMNSSCDYITNVCNDTQQIAESGSFR